LGKNLNSLFRNLFYNALLKNFAWLHRIGAFHSLWKWISLPVFDVKTTLFGAKITMPSTHVFPLLARAIPTFNNPYLELTYRLHLQKNTPLNIVDAGASIGDTFLFIYKNLPEAIDKIICIEGHPLFYKYLEMNTREYSGAVRLMAVLSGKDETIQGLVTTHSSTASSQDTTTVKAEPLDHILSRLTTKPIDIIKIDVDGFDGKVLAGAKNILTRFQPHIIFEYHPLLLQQTNNDLMQPFAVLEECGYYTLLWFDKFGVFSHSSNTSDTAALKQLAAAYLQQKKEDDIHFDIIALPASSGIDPAELQACEFSKRKKLFY
jgi:FkbM family methyltransferase